MTHPEAVKAVITLCGGAAVNTSPVYRFGSLTAADRCKAILDALLPAGSTGEVCNTGLLMVSRAA